MTEGKVRAAITVAERFMTEARALLREQQELTPESYYFGSKRSGAVRRASMDLTRALAAMRRPGAR